MAGIRKIEAPRVQQPTTTSLEQAQQKPKLLSAVELSQLLQKVFSNGAVHGNELPTLKDALARAGDQKADLVQNIERRLADPNLKVTPETLDGLKALGVDVTRATEHLKKNTDLRTSETLGQTADKTVADKVQGEAASQNALGAQKAILDSHKGASVAKNELTPEFKLAKQLVGDVAGRIFSEKAPPELKAIQEAIGPQVGALAQQTALSVMSDPNAMANISSLFAKVGKEGFQAALSSSTKEIAGHFLQSAGVQAKNPAAIKAALQGIEQMAPKLSSSLGPKIAETASKLGPRLLGEGAEIAAKAGASAAAAGAAGAAAGVAGAATKGAATTALKTGAKAGGQALPVIGNFISMGSTLLAGANFIGQLVKKPHDFEKVMKEGINTALQGIGIAFPWVGLGGTLVDSAWGAKVSVSDQKKQQAGIPVTENADIAAALPLLTDSAHVLQAVLTGAGKHDAADKLGSLVATTKTMAHLDLNNPGDRLALLRKDEQQALIALAHESKGELEKLSGAESGPRKEALVKLASVFGALADTTLSTLRFDKREQAPGFDDKAKKDLETKRNELAGNLLKQLGDLGVAEMLRRSEEPKTA